MGVIKKVLYRGNVLGNPRHRNLFLDMEENIHIHYRDLRIELSRGEFEDFAATFARQSAELIAIIKERNYQDGKLPNANQEDVRIWTESRLKHDIKYHPTRISLEECGDGYHLHYRNYKILIDSDDFRNIIQLFKALDLNSSYPGTYDEVIDLLKANDIDFVIDAGNLPPEKLIIRVAKYHLPKIREIFKYIGFSLEEDGSSSYYKGSRLSVGVRVETSLTTTDYRRIRSHNNVVRLVDYLASMQGLIEENEINEIKLQVLNLYIDLERRERINVETDPQKWLYASENRQVIFPFRAEMLSSTIKTDNLYRVWSVLINSFNMSFVKPEKNLLPLDMQESLKSKINIALRREVASFVAVKKVYLMGSVLRSNMGVYQVPFVHGKLVKLGSDVDILVEIDADREADVPPKWSLYNSEASNHCAVYHIGQIPLMADAGNWLESFPCIKFIGHLLDAYVYFPSRGHRSDVDAFLKKFGARCVFDRSEQEVFYHGEFEKRLAAHLKSVFDFIRPTVERMKVSTENDIFLVVAGGKDYILKLFKVSGNYHKSHLAGHVGYEQELIEQLRSRNFKTPAVLKSVKGGDMKIDGFPMLLFERQKGRIEKRPEYLIEKIAQALAEMHLTQIENPLKISSNFVFDDVCMIWLPVFAQYVTGGSELKEVARALKVLDPIAEPLHRGENRGPMYLRSPFVHCHGDVAPKNVILDAENGVHFIDFNNAFFGPRIADVLDGAYEFSLAEKYIDLADFDRFDLFMDSYRSVACLSAGELEDLPRWVDLIGIIKFTKELRVAMDPVQKRPVNLRTKRALAIAKFLEDRQR